MVLILWFLALVAAGDVLAYLVGLFVEYEWGSYPSGSNLTFESWKGFPSGSLHASLAHANRNFHYSQAC